MSNNNNNDKNKKIISSLVTTIVIIMFVTIFVVSEFGREDVAVPIFITLWCVLFFGGFGFAIYSTIKSVKQGKKTIQKMREMEEKGYPDKYVVNPETEEKERLEEEERNKEVVNPYFDPLDKELDHVSQRLKADNNICKNGGVIKDKSTDMDKNGEVAYFAEVMDFVTNSTFTTKLSVEDYQKIYVGKNVEIARGFKRKIKF